MRFAALVFAAALAGCSYECPEHSVSDTQTTTVDELDVGGRSIGASEVRLETAGDGTFSFDFSGGRLVCFTPIAEATDGPRSFSEWCREDTLELLEPDDVILGCDVPVLATIQVEVDGELHPAHPPAEGTMVRAAVRVEVPETDLACPVYQRGSVVRTSTVHVFVRSLKTELQRVFHHDEHTCVDLGVDVPPPSRG